MNHRLVGQRVDISICEPWDFESEAGPNRLEGVVELCEKNRRLGIVREITGRKRERVFAYTRYLAILGEGTEPL